MMMKLFKGISAVLLVIIMNSCSQNEPNNDCIYKTAPWDFKISLAEWSLHKSLFSNEMSNLDFPRVAKQEYGIEAIEYVNQFFSDKATDSLYLQQLKDSCSKYNVTSVLIMIDGEGSLASNDSLARDSAVFNHYKWVDAAKFLGCHSIRVNLHGEDVTEEEWKEASIKSLKKLCAYGESKKLNIIVENHGQWSSKGSLLAEVITGVDSKYCGTLPDFGNFCVRRRDGDLWESPCVEEYDKYKGVEEMMPFAKGVSAKAFEFDDNGNETTIDFKKMLNIIKNTSYYGYIGIEFEGGNHTEKEGIIATKNLLLKVKKALNNKK